jgi:hypothetical protein
LTGTWTLVSNLAPSGTGTMLLLSDGTIMVQGGFQAASSAWDRLVPDPFGGYANGTWSQLASMSLERLYFPSNVLPDGRVLVMGGEYSGPSNQYTRTNTGEIYDPVADAWSSIAIYPQQYLGDDPSQLLPDGSVLIGSPSDDSTYIYVPDSNTWYFTAKKALGDPSVEETWLKLPDDSILSYNVWANLQGGFGAGSAERYVPSLNQWVATGNVTVALSSDAVDNEIGPAFLLPDGRAFFLGATGQTALYTISTNSWTAGPPIPDGLGVADSPGAMMPDGKILLAANPLISNGQFQGPTTIFEFDPTTNKYTDVTPAGYDLSSAGYATRMLVLPSGQVLMTNGSTQLLLYTPDLPPASAWQPTITQIVPNPDGSYTLTGTQLNGISQGAAYGDDAEMDTNYPIVRLSSSNGRVYYARTFDWSSTGVATGSALESTLFTLPAGFLPGTYSLSVAASGIASNPTSFTYAYPSAISVTSAVLEPAYGQSETFTATVTTSSATSSIPTGTVQFVIDGNNYGPPIALDGDDSASLSTASLAAGTHTVKAIYSGDANFASSAASVVQAIATAPLTVTAEAESMTYGETVPPLTYSVSGLVGGVLPISVFSGELATLGTPSSKVGDYPITQGTLVCNTNYTMSFTPATLSINPARLNVQALDQPIFYGGAFPTLTYSVSGLVNGDTAGSVLYGALATTAAPSSGVGDYPITQGTLISNANYTISFRGGTLSIAPPLVTVTGVELVMGPRHLAAQILVSYSGPINASEADQLTTYRLASAGSKGSYTAKNARVIKLKSAVYNAATDTVVLAPRKPFALSARVQLVVYGTGPSGQQDSYGRLIDGAHNGTAGSNAVALLTRHGATINSARSISTTVDVRQPRRIAAAATAALAGRERLHRSASLDG